MEHNFELIFLIVTVVGYIILIRKAKAGKYPNIRALTCLEAMPEAVQRAAEMGTSIHFATGNVGLDAAEAPVAVAGIAMLGYAAKLCGEYKVPIHYTCIWGYMIPIAQDLIRRGYQLGGIPEMYSDDMIEYTGNDQRAYGAAMQGYIWREKPAVNMLFGGTQWEAFDTLGAGAVVGAMQLGGTSRIYYQPFMIACCDYSLIGDELYAAAAEVTGVPEERACIQAMDINKALSLLLIILSVILATAGSQLFEQLIAW